MPSHLTRVVFRSIIANEPLLYRGCRNRTVGARLAHRQGVRAFPQIQRRTFLDNLFTQRRKLKPLEFPAGLQTLSDLAHAQRTGIRPPEAQDIAHALKAFFAQRKGPFEDWHIERAYNAFQYLLENTRDDGRAWFSAEDLASSTPSTPSKSSIYHQLLKPSHLPTSGGSEHVRFGKAVLHEYAKLLKDGPRDEAKPSGKLTDPSDEVALKLVQLLSNFGAAAEAREICVSNFAWDTNAPLEKRTASHKAWAFMLQGIARQGDPEEMMTTTTLLQRLDIPVTAAMQYDLVTFFGEQKNIDEAKFWYTYPVAEEPGKGSGTPQGNTSAALLKACALCGELSYGHEVVTSLLKNDLPDKESWDAVFLWSAAIGKGVDEVDRMMSVMIRRNDEARRKNPSLTVIRPDVDTINALVEFSISKEDPYSAERYIALGEKRGISPDEKTYTMQIQYRLSVKDVDGARAAYFNLQGEFTGAKQSVAVINQLIRTLCESHQHHFDELMAMVDDLRERNAIFPPETIAALCVLHLRRGEDLDAKDLLQLYAHQFAPEQRRVIQKALLAFLLDSETSTADAWDAYQIIRNVFGETPREDRIKVMNEFFARKRSDMACHVFFHMRNHVSPSHTANKEVYIAAFTGFARCADAESLELAHNQLKLDFNVDADTRLRNALMLAYASTGQNNKALQFWREICESKEGPSYNSLAIALRSCEGMHFGHAHASSIWKRLKEQDVEIDKTIWTAYMCAVARNHQHDEAQTLIENVEEEYGFPLDIHILGNWFNMTANSVRQERVEAWIKQHHPKIWEELEALGHWVTMDGFGYRQYNLNRDLDP